jgi:hypothetical protein
MRTLLRKVVPEHALASAFEMYRNSSNQIMLDGVPSERHYPSSIGHFMISEFTPEEMQPVLEHAVPVIEKAVGPVQVVYCRLLKYTTGCFIQPHVDSYNPDSQQENDLSVIIQMNPAVDFRGGFLMLQNRMMDMQPGDLTMYTYEQEHEVKPIRTGTRYVINLRCKMVK